MCCILTLWTALVALAQPAVTVSPAKVDEQGFLVHEIQSPYQAGTTLVRVLLPDKLELVRSYPAIYVLPVERLNESRFGDGLLEIQKHNLHNKHQTVFVAPTFSHLPWYADHPKQPEIRQETYLIKVVVPLVERTYAVRKQVADRRLLGFSKSGWGAFSLLLRHPHIFGQAAAWDAPLMMAEPNRYGMAEIFATQENFEEYQISRLLPRRAEELGERTRLVLTGFGNFRDHHQRVHALMDELGIKHVERDGPERKHDWHSGWVEEAVKLLLEVTD